MERFARCPICGTPRRGEVCLRCSERIEKPRYVHERRHGPLGEFQHGLRLAIRGASLTLSRPHLLVLVIVPLVISVLLFAGLVWLVVVNRDVFRPEFTEPWPFGLDWLRGFAAASAQVVAVVLAVIVALLGTLLASTVVNAPFLEWLSEAVETLIYGQCDQNRFSAQYVWDNWVVPVFQAAGVAVVQAAISVVLLVLSFTGVLSPLLFAAAVYLTAVTLVDVVIARKRYPVAARFRLAGGPLALWLGLALPFAFLPFLLPLGVAGATMAFVREGYLRTAVERARR